MKILNGYYRHEHKYEEIIAGVGHFFNLGIRFYLLSIFFQSGLTKLRDWDSTLFLFEEEYQVPLLPADLAAYLGTAGELILPALLMLGLFSRFSAAGLFVVNAVAAISLAEISDAAFTQHLFWGTLALYLVVYGGQRWSIDRLFSRKLI